MDQENKVGVLVIQSIGELDLVLGIAKMLLEL